MTSAEAQARTPVEDNDSGPLEEWEILTIIVEALVEHPEAVRVEDQHNGDASYFLIHVADADLGKVIGKNGETVSTIRKLFGRISAGRGRKTFIHVAEPNRRPLSHPFSKRTAPRRNAAA